MSLEQPRLIISVTDHEEGARVGIASSLPLSSTLEQVSPFLYVKIRTREPFRIQREAFSSRFVRSVGWSTGKDVLTLAIRTRLSDFSYEVFKVQDPTQLIIDIRPAGPQERSESATEESGSVSAPQEPECIVIDPGHGGIETGARGRFGTLEKDLTLAIGLKLAQIIKQRRASNVVLTRDRDVEVSLDDRAAIANNNKATLFISIHVNSSFRKGAAGPETYFLSRNATDEEARRLAFLENTSEELDSNIEADDEDVIRMILWDMAQAAFLKQSSELAEDIQNALNVVWKTGNRGIKQAPFKVLTGVACPAVLVEVAFLSNPLEERRLLTEEVQMRVAEAIYEGLAQFLKRNSQL